MKPMILITVVAEAFCVSTMAFADFDVNKQLQCETEDGIRILINDSLIGGSGKAVVGHADQVYKVSSWKDNNEVAHFGLNYSVRAAGPSYTLSIDTRLIETTSRREGPETKAYYFAPAQLTTNAIFNGTKSVPTKCFQPAS
jgi:hypothetical protein